MTVPLETTLPNFSGAVKTIAVEGLFGQFDYGLTGVAADLHHSHGDVLILYGDNGSGKTTILKLLFHLLSAANNRGHRHALAKIPFRKFAVTLRDDTIITLSRSAQLLGSYHLEVHRDTEKLLAVNFDPERKGKGKFGSEEEEGSLLDFLQGLAQTVYFLSADRQIDSDQVPRKDQHQIGEEQWILLHGELIRHSQMPHRARTRPFSTRSSSPLVARALHLAAEWIKKQHLRAANRGTDSSHNIYSDIVRHISRSRDAQVLEGSHGDIIATLHSLANRSAEYARFGLTNALQVDEMVDALKSATGSGAEIIERVLNPYITGTNARLDQLQEIHNLTGTFVRNVNSFYRNKMLTFDLNDGFKISLTNGSELNPDLLSSGEKQLLVLFCYTLISNDSRSIFIIDEPELSLNIKWQRSLLQALLDIVRSGSVQFILATHSIEILSDHLVKVVKLEPISKETNAVPEANRASE